MRAIETIDAIISKLRTTLQELKNAQFIGGDSWIFYKIVTNDTWDINTSIPTAGNSKAFRIDFTPDNPKIQAAAEIRLERDWNVSFRNALLATQGNNPHSWTYRITAVDPGLTFKAKFMIASTQSGTINVTAL